ncbi:MAG: hypothetical protein DSM106950_42120 [Stigonema ocellatum SAG 48.90 = DSM 106950]|nr:hypothetical protein [Stigonema ocellatum SAG 48.90 = DSM 106950]
MFNKTISISLAVVLYCSTVKPIIAQPVPVLALPLVANPAGLVFLGVVTVAGVSWYIYENHHHQRYRSRVAPNSTVHSESGEYLEELITIKGSPGASTKCYEIAEERTRSTGRKWRVKSNKLMRGTGGVAQPGKLLDWECIITDAPL